ATGGAGGTATGGVGGAATGGSGGGTGGAGGSGPPPCYATTFTAPASGATLTVADDSNGTCADGFQYTVTITSGAPDGTNVSLYDGSSLLKTVQVSGGAASFAVQLATGGTAQQLSIQYPSTQTCNVSENVTVNCPNSPPTCSIAKPVISATHPDLNGVPVAQGGDRSSSSGSNYQATFVVSTNAEDGQTVTLAVDNILAPGTPVDGMPTATVSGGSASFGLTLTPDGTYEVVATCLNKEGITGTSTKSTFTVDTTAPDLIINSPSAGQFVVGGTVAVCAQTDSTDAAGLAASLGAGQNNLCVTLGSSATPTCTPVAAINTSTCINFACPGSAPFSVSVTLSDAAGNPQTQTITGVTCASTRPSVQIVAPASDAPTFTTPADHILNANTTVGVPDEDGATPGAQADVVACTDTAGTAALFVGHQGDASLAQLGASISTAAAASTDNCPSGLAFVARFAGVTLPESNENADGTLAAATEMQVTVTASGNAADTGTSGVDDVWVDSELPNLALISPAGLCGSFTQSATTVTDDVAYTADDKLVVADVTNNGTTTTYDTPAYVAGVATFGNVAFAAGQNTLVATETDPAGNVTTLPACVVTIGAAPVVTFTNPTAGALLCPSGATATGCIDDADTGTVGWQGTLTVHVTASGANVNGSVITFTDGTTNFGTATTDANGNATLTPVTVPEGIQTIVATTDNVPGAGVGSGNVTVTVDTTPPNAPTNLTALVLDRRKTSMQLTWTAPSDAGGGNVSGYQIRYAKVPITVTNFNDATVTTAVTYTGTPASPGQLDGLTVGPLYIENGYYFAVEAVNVAGSASGIVATSTAVTAHFNTVTLTGNTGSTTEGAGFTMDGSGDANGDGLSDMLSGSYNGLRAYLFLGNSNFAPTAASVAFTSTSPGFGRGVSFIGDIDHDGREDIAIANTSTNVVYVYRGRATWPMAMTDADADFTITADSSYTGSLFGSEMARLGDFNGDGVDDFAIGSPDYGPTTFAGRVTIVLGQSGFTSVALPNVTRAITIDGTAFVGIFGARVMGIGPFYSPTGGSELIVGAPGLTGFASSTGSIYAFRAQAATGGAIPLSSADASIIGSSSSAGIGALLTNLGTLSNGLAQVGSGNPTDTSVPAGTGSIYLFAGNTSSGPLSNQKTLYFSGTSLDPYVLIGGGVPGRTISVSVIGDGTPDIIVAPRNGGKVAIIDGSKVAALTSPANVAATADVLINFPAGLGLPNNSDGTLLPDVNGDGFADFAISDGSSTDAGNTVIFY
ncbi:MAG TPA: FG-GAP-like repeat-containing protein, partial [Polyangia bacterium]|nr:FG-GAP-like repeat-containing protein [Polyangia bacterium]